MHILSLSIPDFEDLVWSELSTSDYVNGRKRSTRRSACGGNKKFFTRVQRKQKRVQQRLARRKNRG